MRVGGLLACKQFTWDEWLEPEQKSDSIPIKDWLDRFEQDYFNKRARTPKTETSFRDYLKTCELFSDRQKPLTTDTILAAVIKAEPDSRRRTLRLIPQILNRPLAKKRIDPPNPP